MIQLLIIAAYLALLLGLGLYAGRHFRGTSADYLLASHSIGPVLLLMSLFGTTMTAFALVGSTGEAYVLGIGVYGLLASSSGIVHSLCFYLLGVRLWAFGRRHGYKTQIEFFRDRLESDRIGLLLFPVLVALVIPYLLIGVIGAGAVVNGVTQGTFAEGTFPAVLEQGTAGFAVDGSRGGLPRPLASLVICVVVLLYVFTGGMRGTAWANTLQTAVFMGLGVVTFVVIAQRLGGQTGLLDNLRAVIADVPADKLTSAEIPRMKFFGYLLIPLSVGMFPHVFQHWLTARSAATFKLPIVLHPIFILIVWLPCVLVGVWASGELAAVPSSVRPNEVLAYLVQKLAGPVLAGLLSAGILAAIMSSLDSQFLCLGTMFTHDVVLHHARRPFGDRQIVTLARTFIVAIVAITYGLSLFEAPRVFSLGIWCFSGFTALTPLALAAVYWRRLTLAGAYASILTAIGCWGWLFWSADFGRRADYTAHLPGLAVDVPPVIVMFVAATLALVVVSRATKPPSAATLARFFPHPAGQRPTG